ncbi:biotin--[acetyl-CoA-carboxylase] ligase [Caldicellulosiruptor morganii]|uniref:Bifunctional ligase/repressor BirA n=1 Tax=Caldicellulosiruptor morganii TaxID=1387555 RepID=A0ABY7BM56_9FIRM|nr:biotin--[acetyl-CoA-carboxylase] ligase [Caldicellulosiruptor morganii]WAM33927.1 biotin--[acetyl-CoA-carboxylase] ligase [Caldicellulosiruptor morganii]
MDEKSIYILKKLYEDEFVSGESLANELKISRMAVNKRIKSLQQMGFSVASYKKKGYQLVDRDIIRLWQVKDFISSSNLFSDFLYFPQIDSTNSYIKENQQKLVSGTVVYAERQSAGRGRLGRSWVDLEKGIKMSIFLKLGLLDIEKVVPLTLFTGLVVNRVLRRYNVHSFIKWSNDIILNNKKVCGILTELSGELEGSASIIIGMGLNVNCEKIPDEIAEIATSLKKETGSHFDRTDLLIEILKEFESEFENFKNHGFLHFRDEYKSFCINLGKEIVINGTQRAFCKDIGQNGELIVEMDGRIQKIQSGEVTIRW